MKNLLYAFVLVPFLCSTALASDLEAYGYEQRVQLVPVAKSTTVGVSLPTESLNQVNAKFSNIELINARNETVPFSIYDEDQAMVTEIDRLTVSSIRDGNDPAHLLDNDRTTDFTFSEKVDGANPSTILVDFGRELDIHRIKIWTPNRSHIRGMGIKMGVNKDRLKTVKSKTAFNRTIDGSFPLARFVEISLWGPSITVDDILFYTRPNAEVYFTAQPGMSYKLLLGNSATSVYRFTSRDGTKESPQVKAKLGPLEFNRLASDDIDGDTVLNEEDNCPFIANKSQKDKDEDGHGNDCDNVPNQKNYDQSDVDLDGIGDLIDNCKLIANEGQYDTDKDGIGNACDTTEEAGEGVKDPTLKKDSMAPLLGLGVLLLLAIAGAAWFFIKKKK